MTFLGGKLGILGGKLQPLKYPRQNPGHDGSHFQLIERPVVLTRSRRVTAALIAKYVNPASSLFTGAHAFHIRLSHRNSYSVGIFCIIFDIIL